MASFATLLVDDRLELGVIDCHDANRDGTVVR
jgi:hypothetical protein